jgi:hypothetical protein
VTSDATFPSSISTPTSPIDSVGTLKVRNHCHATSPFTCCLTANLQPINHWVLTFNIQCILHIGVTHLSPVSLMPSSIVPAPKFPPLHRYWIPPSQCPMAAVSGPSKASTARHPSSFRKAQKISRPSAATTAHRRASVCDLSKLYCKLFPTEFLTPRVLAGTTRIMDTSTAKLCGHFVSHRSHAPPSPQYPRGFSFRLDFTSVVGLKCLPMRTGLDLSSTFKAPILTARNLRLFRRRMGLSFPALRSHTPPSC